MFNQSPDHGLAVLQDTTRAFQAIAAETGDYAQRLMVEGTAALTQMTAAKSVSESFNIFAAYSKKTFEENMQQMARLQSMFASAASDHARAVQALMIAAPK